MKNSYIPTRLPRLALAATLLAYGTVGIFAQTAPASQDVQALIAEVRELKSRLAAVEAKLAAYPDAPVIQTVGPRCRIAPVNAHAGRPEYLR